MVNQRKIAQVRELEEKIKGYSVIGLVDLYKLPSKTLQSIRKDLRGEVEILMRKKCIFERTFRELKDKKDVEKLLEIHTKKPAIILTNMSPFRLNKILDQNKSPTFAKEGDIALDDIIIPAGPTPLAAGPAIGDLQRAKIPAMVQDGKIHVRQDTILVKKGGEIKAEAANILKKLNIQPMFIKMDLVAAWEKGVIFGKEILQIDEKEYLEKVKGAYTHAMNLSVNVGYPTRQNIELILHKAYRQAKTLGLECNILDKGIIEDILGRIQITAQNLKTKIGFND